MKILKLSGYAARFGVMSDRIRDATGEYREIVQQGAFRQSIWGKRDIVCTVEHAAKAIAMKSNGSLRLLENSYGLRADIDLDDTPEFRAVYERVRSGELSKMSFRFRGKTIERDIDPASIEVRTIIEAELLEVSLMTAAGAYYPQTTIATRKEFLSPSTAALKSAPPKLENVFMFRR